MYCSKCGQQIPDNSVFCSECGNKCGSDLKNDIIKNAKSNYGEYINYAIAAIKHPINTIKSGGENISTRINLLYIAIIALIVPLIQTISFRLSIFNGAKSIFELINKFENGNSSVNQMIKFKEQLNKFMDTFISFSDIYIFNFLGYILFYGILLGGIYLTYKYLIKAEFSSKDFTRILVVISIINFIVVITTAILLPISLFISLFISIISAILIITILVIGLNHILNSDDKFVYIFSVYYVISIIVANYLGIKWLINSFDLIKVLNLLFNLL